MTKIPRPQNAEELKLLLLKLRAQLLILSSAHADWNKLHNIAGQALFCLNEYEGSVNPDVAEAIQQLYDVAANIETARQKAVNAMTAHISQHTGAK